MGNEIVQAVLDDVEHAPVAEPLRAALLLLRKVTRAAETVTVDDMRAVLAAGATRAQVEEALLVAYAFNVITRLADTFEFEVGSPESFDVGARHLLRRGYN
jgi:alkylhydroperoxidase family enzyme